MQAHVNSVFALLPFSAYDGSGDMETVAEGTHSAVKKDVILRLETLTVQETKVGSPHELLPQDKAEHVTCSNIDCPGVTCRAQDIIVVKHHRAST